jgi:hypothetical protein
MRRLGDDLVARVLQTLTVRQLGRAGAVCKQWRAAVRGRGVMRQAVLNTFPGIAGLPADGCFFTYLKAARCFYGTYQTDLKRSEADVSSAIAECVAARHAGYKPAPLQGILRSVMLNKLWRFTRTDADRRLIADRARACRAGCTLHPPHFLANAREILDAIASIAESNFRWSRDGYIECHW